MKSSWYYLDEICKTEKGKPAHIVYGHNFIDGSITKTCCDLEELQQIISKGRAINFEIRDEYVMGNATVKDTVVPLTEESNIEYYPSIYDVLKLLVVNDCLIYCPKAGYYKEGSSLRVSNSSAFAGFSVKNDVEEWFTESVVYHDERGEPQVRQLEILVPIENRKVMDTLLDWHDEAILEITEQDDEPRTVYGKKCILVKLLWEMENITRMYKNPTPITPTWMGYLATNMLIQKSHEFLLYKQLQMDSETTTQERDFIDKTIEPYTMEMIVRTKFLTKNEYWKLFAKCFAAKSRDNLDLYEEYLFEDANYVEAESIRDFFNFLDNATDMTPEILIQQHKNIRKQKIILALELASYRATFREYLDLISPEGQITHVDYNELLRISFIRKGDLDCHLS